jgi:hypothetical protein
MILPIFLSLGGESNPEDEDTRLVDQRQILEWNPKMDDFPFLDSSLEDLGWDPEDWLDKVGRWREEDWESLDKPTGLLYATHRIQNECRELLSPKFQLEPSEYTPLWNQCMEESANLIFPEYASEIIVLSRKLEEYNKWDLNQIQAQSEELIWEKRNQLFGKKYVESVYSQEWENYQAKKELEKITETPVSLSSQWNMFQESIQDKNPSEDGRLNFAEMFLESPSIQNQLKKADPEERSQILKKIRNSANLPEEKILSLEEYDSKRIEEARSENPGSQTFFLQ